MADGTKIEWTEATWNPITGCSVLSSGCTNCYAMQLAGTRLEHHPSRAGLTRLSGGRPKWTGEVRFNEAWLADPLKWKRPRMIFVCAHGDLFHESVPDAWIDRVFAVMALCPQHTFQVLTKRSARMREYFSKVRDEGGICDSMSIVWERAMDIATDRGLLECYQPQIRTLPNVWLGVSVEDQQRADERIPDLLATPAAVRWLSCEPLLGWVDVAWALGDRLGIAAGFLSRGQFSPGLEKLRRLDWIVTGGESGRGARPMHPDWARSLRDQCAAAGVPFFFKQWGTWGLALEREKDDPDWRADYSNEYADRGNSQWLNAEGGGGFHGERFVVMRKVGKTISGRHLDGHLHDAMPAHG